MIQTLTKIPGPQFLIIFALLAFVCIYFAWYWANADGSGDYRMPGPNGDLYPCRRMPVRVGNILETPLSELYNCEIFRNLRNKEKISVACQGCLYAGACRGGLRCLSYAVTGDPFRTDPGCWIGGKSS